MRCEKSRLSLRHRGQRQWSFAAMKLPCSLKLVCARRALGGKRSTCQRAPSMEEASKCCVCAPEKYVRGPTDQLQQYFVQRPCKAKREFHEGQQYGELKHSFCKRCNKHDQSNMHSRCVHVTATSKSHTNKHFDHASSPASSSNRHQSERRKLHPYRHLSANFEIFWRASRTMLRDAEPQEAPTMVKQNPIIENGSLQGP